MNRALHWAVSAAIIFLALVAGGVVGSLVFLRVTGGTGQLSTDLEAPPMEPSAPREVQYVVDVAASEVRFRIDEELSGRPFEVVGTTDQLSGSISIVGDDITFGPFRINARALQTDDPRRDRAIRGQILLSARDEYELIEYVPTRVEGLPAALADGRTVALSVTGDLTIRDVTLPVTFSLNLRQESDRGALVGDGATTIAYADYGIVVRTPPFVANVSPTVTLEIEFRALSLEAAGAAPARE